MKPFSIDQIPKRELSVRMAGSAAAVCFVAILLVSPLKELLGFGQSSGFLSNLLNIPSQCLASEAVNEFRRKQCEQFWSQLVVDLLMAAVPLVLAYLTWNSVRDQITGLYRKMGHKVGEGKASFPGVVTNPAEAPNDLYGRFFLLRAISVELQNKSQVRIYQPQAADVPMPGQTMAVFEHEKRLYGVLYTPEVSVR